MKHKQTFVLILISMLFYSACSTEDFSSEFDVIESEITQLQENLIDLENDKEILQAEIDLQNITLSESNEDKSLKQENLDAQESLLVPLLTQNLDLDEQIKPETNKKAALERLISTFTAEADELLEELQRLKDGDFTNG